MQVRRALPLVAGTMCAAVTGGALMAGTASTASASAAATPTTTSLTVSTSRVVFGREDDEHLTVNVAGATPTGQVTITDGTVVVTTIILAGGTGTATLTPAQLSPGIHRLVATYGGDQANSGSSSAPKALSVFPTPASTASAP